MNSIRQSNSSSPPPTGNAAALPSAHEAAQRALTQREASLSHAPSSIKPDEVVALAQLMFRTMPEDRSACGPKVNRLFDLPIESLTKTQLQAIEPLYTLLAGTVFNLNETEWGELGNRKVFERYETLKLLTQNKQSEPCQALALEMLSTIEKTVAKEKKITGIALAFALAGRYADLFPENAAQMLTETFKKIARHFCPEIKKLDSLTINELASQLLEQFAQEWRNYDKNVAFCDGVTHLLCNGLVLLARRKVVTHLSTLNSLMRQYPYQAVSHNPFPISSV